MKKILTLFLIGSLTLATSQIAHAKKEKIPKMPETKAEWLEKSECVPVEKRKIEEKGINKDKKLRKKAQYIQEKSLLQILKRQELFIITTTVLTIKLARSFL